MEKLLTLRRYLLDTMQKQLGQLLEQRRLCLEEKEALKARLEKERLFIRQHPEHASLYGPFAQHIKAEQESLAQQHMSLDRAIDTMRDQLMEAFKDLKSLDILQKRKEEERQQERDQEEQDRLDERAALPQKDTLS